MGDPKRKHNVEQSDDLNSPLDLSDDVERGAVDAGESSEDALADERLIHPYITNRHGAEQK